MSRSRLILCFWTPALCLSMGTASLAFGDDLRGRIVINGAGEASADPEMAQFEVTVTSMCYESSRAAKEANAAMAQKIIDTLHPFTLDPRDQVVATGGPNLRQTEVIPDGTTYKTLCERKWRSTNRIIFKFSRIESVPEVQDAIFATLDQAGGVDEDKIAQTYAEMTQPHFDVYPETATRLEHEAQGKAYDDALSQFAVFKKRCAFVDERLTLITQPQYEVMPRLRGAGIYAASTPTPIIPDEIVYRANWRFEWSYAAPLGCVP